MSGASAASLHFLAVGKHPSLLCEVKKSKMDLQINFMRMTTIINKVINEINIIRNNKH